MSKLLLTTAVIFLTASCNSINKPQPRQSAQEEPDYSEDAYYPENTEYSEWSGPGWYWGVYINNENDYWNHNNNYRNRQGGNHGRNNQRPDERGGGGHGGGGHR